MVILKVNFSLQIRKLCNIYLGPEDEKLHVITEPKASYRERYSCETDPKKNRAQRYIRAEMNNNKHEYPTVKVSNSNFSSSGSIIFSVYRFLENGAIQNDQHISELHWLQ